MIKKWVLKAIIQKVISYLPYSHRLNFFFQKYITKGVQLTDFYFEDRLIHAKKHINSFDKYASVNLNKTLELGTGWYPVVPISLFLRGAQQINTVDISALCNKENLIRTIQFFIDYHQNGKLKDYFEVNENRFAVLKTIVEDVQSIDFEGIANKLKINFHVCDIKKINFEDHSIDLIHSNNTFEHVFPDVLKGILIKFKTLATNGGVMSHFIDMSDHFAHFDTTINIYNYLSFSDNAWAWIDNSVQPQNRWRLSEYQILYRSLEIDMSETDYRRGNMEEVQSIRLADKYQNYDQKDLAISHCYLISKM